MPDFTRHMATLSWALVWLMKIRRREIIDVK